MGSVLNSGSSGLGSNPDWGHCVVILTPRWMVTLMLGGSPVMGGGVEMLLVTS